MQTSGDDWNKITFRQFFYYYVSISDIMGWFLSVTEIGADNAKTYNTFRQNLQYFSP